ncbi:MAG: hypothetical protein K8W52_37225 [Deltaproteobacteria bacterium]|nr:hypothetical protein [Deltaproteobacteria bacterium]
MKKNTEKKLTLAAQTVVTLNTVQLVAAAGAGLPNSRGICSAKFNC